MNLRICFCYAKNVTKNHQTHKIQKTFSSGFTRKERMNQDHLALTLKNFLKITCKIARRKVKTHLLAILKRQKDLLMERKFQNQQHIWH